MVVLLMGLGSCQKEKTPSQQAQQETIPRLPIENSTVAMIEYMVLPKFGKPNTTMYYFHVYDPAGILAISVKLYEKSTGMLTYLPMTRLGNYWTLSTMISTNGWFDWRYVYSINKNNISGIAYVLCNTNNNFSPIGVSSLTWPFGADGSTFINRQGWIGAMEEGGCGSGWNEGGHHYYSCGADDSYAEDWNKICSTPYADDGTVVRSPLDGKVVRVFFDSPSYHNGGYGNAIDIQQESCDGILYVFRIAHLKYAPLLSLGDYVRAGSTPIGHIGMSGGTSTAPHAHCALYHVTNGCNAKSKFLFTAP
ncbi:MAG: peptidoglycan DD-metalloendopeptidase family protein [bacterium]